MQDGSAAFLLPGIQIVLIYVGLLQEYFITTHLHDHLGKHMISRYIMYKDFPRAQPKLLHSTQRSFNHNKENAYI